MRAELQELVGPSCTAIEGEGVVCTSSDLQAKNEASKHHRGAPSWSCHEKILLRGPLEQKLKGSCKKPTGEGSTELRW